ncbi:glycosyltransferase family 4 protein [Sphingomonas sp. RIT328]|uniref:glycosyltransferase family 4 protein n=1 Tax=Sphingomonas sp. RIT328 TaxID=1470591 RepID=UPI00044DE0FE|nr:glycosyltransferase family 4 protein [Sphingomonas sp. RIT328]EZP57498.1 glycosyltransferase, family [Sphingomonas sp. RIT328]
MRLLLTTDAVGGVWQYTAELAVALAARGVTSVVAVLGPPPNADQRAMLDAAGRAVTLVVTGLPLDWTCHEAAPVEAAGAAIAALAVAQGVELIHYNMPTLAAAGAPLPSIAVAHGCVATWWQAARDVPLAAAYRWHRALTATGLRAVDRVVAPSAAYAEVVARHYALARPVLAIHNGRSLPEVAPAGAPADVALTVGRLWDDVKNAALLDRAAARLPIPFLAAGATRGPHGETIQLEHLHRLGEVSGAQLARHLARRPIFVSAARFEPFGLAVLEAAQAGCALVLADIPTFRELWEGVALFVPADGHDHGWCRAIEALALDGPRRAALGEAARLRAARYTPAATADQMLALYRATLTRPTIRRAAA